MHDFAGFAALDDKGDAGSAAFTDEVVMNRRQREEGRDGGGVGVDAAITEDQDGVAGFDGPGGAFAERIEGAFEFHLAAVHVVQGR